MMYSGQYALGKNFLLNSGYTMPAVGLNTCRSRLEGEVYEVVNQALSAGYRLFDTSPLYCNEGALRHAFANLLPNYNLERKDIFITSKLSKAAMGNDVNTTVREIFEQSLANLGIDYFDLYLISSSVERAMDLKCAWEILQNLHDERYVMSIGVTDFSVPQLKHVMEDSVTPSLNQLEWHPLKRNREMLEFCSENDIQIQAYSPFGSPFAHRKRLFQNRMMRKLAEKYEVPISQILLMWSLQQGVSVVPASHDTLHLKENIDFDLKLSPLDMHRITMLGPDPDDSDPEN